MPKITHKLQIERAMHALSSIKEGRIGILDGIARQIVIQRKKAGNVQIIFICTHNARRSQIAQALLTLTLAELNIKGIEVYSAGTEETQVPSQIGELFVAEGYTCGMEEGKLKLHEEGKELTLYSKKVEQIEGLEDAIAVMVCDQADKMCPFITGVSARFALTYSDPKDQDGTPSESKAYKTCFRKILTEMSYLALILDEQM